MATINVVSAARPRMSHFRQAMFVNSRTLMYQPCAANMYQKNRRTHCETLRLV